MSTLAENLKLFYLGIHENNEPWMYKNKDLSTHALIIGMTGSGKTGLGITLLEEACIDNIPSIIIDPKGDLANLALSFSSQDEFESFDGSGEQSFNSLKNGLEASFQSLERVELFKQSAQVRIYTPKSSSGLEINLLGDFSVPQNLSDEELNTHTLGLANSVLALASIACDDSTSPEIVLIQSIFNHYFLENKSLDLASLIANIINPPFDKIGVLPLNSFFAEQKRMSLAMKLNALIASPSFSAWCKGESLNIANMLFSEQGRARANIFSIAHLNDSERMFFVSILLNSLLGWMRTQQGTSALRAILYMDEIAGYFPPNANPASKAPMMTLLKQARAFGLGCVLSTQNPVDIDYKGLSNIGTWLIGRLQTKQDRDRVISGLVGAGGEYDKGELESLLASLPKRNFLVKNINENALFKISTRYALSYLKGPLDKEQISTLMSEFKSSQTWNSKKTSENSSQNSAPKPAPKSQKTILNAGISEFFAPAQGVLSPYLQGKATLRFSDSNGEFVKQVCYILPCDENAQIAWSSAQSGAFSNLSQNASQNASFKELSAKISALKDFKELKKELKEYIYRNEKLEVFKTPLLSSKLGESKAQFIARLQDIANEALEAKTDEINAKFQSALARAQQKVLKAKERVEKEKSDFLGQGLNTALSIGGALLGFFGSHRSASKALSGARSLGRALNEKNHLNNAQQDFELAKNELDELCARFNDEIKALRDKYKDLSSQINTKELSPKKADIYDEDVILVWA